MAYRKRKATRKTATKKRRTVKRKYGSTGTTMSYSLGKNVTQTYNVVLSEFLNLANWQGVADDALRTRNMRLAQIIGCRKWDQYCNLFQEFKVNKVTITAFYREVEKVESDGTALQDYFRIQSFRIGIYVDARQEHANATIAAVGNDIWEHQNIRFKELRPGEQCTFTLPQIRANVYINNAAAGGTEESETYSRAFWQNTYPAANVDSMVKCRMGQVVISNPGLNSADYIAANADRVQFTVRYYVSFRGALL